MKLSFTTLTLLEWAGDEAASTIIRAWSAEAGWLLDPPHIQIHYLIKPECYVLVVNTAHHHQIVAPTRWSGMWEKRSQTPLLMQLGAPALMAAPYTNFNPNTLDYDYPEME